ncbi:MAG: hypothetical protein ACR652_18260 [Methylocystis sp.]|uniref:hypothetical protein n=1 Tax=Methylocystis sp. TaxID=1911079 RepID=UPI003DA23167
MKHLVGFHAKHITFAGVPKRHLNEWACRRRRAEKMDEAGLRRTPSARTIARLMTTGRDALSKAETVIIAAIEDSIPALVEVRSAVADELS